MDNQPTVIMPCSLPLQTAASTGARLPRNLPVTAQQVVLMDRQHPDRKKAEAMVQKVFEQAYGASLSSFYPFLLGIRDDQGDYRAVAGIRPGRRRLFAEHYLPGSVETLLGSARDTVVEVGNLATCRSGEIRWIIAAVTAFLHGAGFSRVLFTITPLLHNSFRRMGLPLKHLAAARRELLPSDLAQDWGAYYDCGPAVYVGRIATGYEAFRQRVRDNEQLFEAWTRALQLGRTRGRQLRREDP